MMLYLARTMAALTCTCSHSPLEEPPSPHKVVRPVPTNIRYVSAEFWEYVFEASVLDLHPVDTESSKALNPSYVPAVYTVDALTV
jgi:hypothetical protein